MQAREWSKPLVAGAVIGAVLFAAALGFVVFRQRSTQSRSVPDRVAVIVVSRDASDAPIAQAIAVAQAGTLRFVSPETQVTVPGTSARRIADAYSFGGGALVASLLPKADAVPKGAFVAIPEKVWLSVIDEQGIEVDVPQPLEVFDGDRLVSLSAGPQRLNAAETAAVLRAMPFVDEDQRDQLRESVARGILAAMSSAPSVPGIESGLSESAVTRFLGSL